ncbi:MAG: hypothetical protein MI864_23245, partial [Pseudomonadales bacterium]|nr:hypothetical protein [Pseudomonadales bacterium]
KKKTGSARWEKLASLIDPQLLQGLKLLSSTQLKCGVLEHYSGVMNGQVMSVNWLPHLQIPVSMTWQQPRETLNYQLTKVGEGASAFVATVQNYNATDFADIGDNESDPFLVKMINLGYVEHAHSGAYDSAGRALGSHNH